MKRLILVLLLFPRLVLATCTSNDSYSAVVCADNPVHYYRLDQSGNPPASMTDFVAANNGSYTNNHVTGGATGIPCCTDKAVSTTGDIGFFNASLADYSMPTTLNAALTIEGWFNKSDTNAQFLFGGGGLGAANYQYSIQTAAGAKFSAITYTCAGATYLATANDGSYTTGTWLHVVVETLGAGSGDLTHVKLYVNGVLLETATSHSGTFCTGSVNEADIGQRADNIALVPFIGTGDEVAYYNTELSGARVLAHYNAGLGAHPDWPYTVKRGPNVLRWFLDDGKATNTQPLESWILSSAGAGH